MDERPADRAPDPDTTAADAAANDAADEPLNVSPASPSDLEDDLPDLQPGDRPGQTPGE
jgi:hypothetical protein